MNDEVKFEFGIKSNGKLNKFDSNLLSDSIKWITDYG